MEPYSFGSFAAGTILQQHSLMIHLRSPKTFPNFTANTVKLPELQVPIQCELYFLVGVFIVIIIETKTLVVENFPNTITRKAYREIIHVLNGVQAILFVNKKYKK